MGHMERAALPPDRMTALARRGCYVEYDWFGEVRPAYPHGRVDVPSDGERIKVIAGLIERGFGPQILVSHDVCFKTRWPRTAGRATPTSAAMSPNGCGCWEFPRRDRRFARAQPAARWLIGETRPRTRLGSALGSFAEGR